MLNVTSNAVDNILSEAIDHGHNKLTHGILEALFAVGALVGRAGEQRREIHRKRERRGKVERVCRKKRCVGGAAAENGVVVALAAIDLRVEDRDDFARELGPRRDVEHDAVGVAEPVEVAPHLATVDERGPVFARERAERGEHGDEGGDMCVVLVGGIVRVDDTRATCTQNAAQLRNEEFGARARRLGLRGRGAELPHATVATDSCGTILLIDAHSSHCGIGVVSKRAAARRAAAVGANDARKATLRLSVALENAVHCHEFNVVLMRTDRQCGHASKRFVTCDAIRNEKRTQLRRIQCATTAAAGRRRAHR